MEFSRMVVDAIFTESNLTNLRAVPKPFIPGMLRPRITTSGESLLLFFASVEPETLHVEGFCPKPHLPDL